MEIFKEKFIQAHTPIDEVIFPMCKAHHLEYDKKKDIQPEHPIVLDEIQTENNQDAYTTEELATIDKNELVTAEGYLKTLPLNTIKSKVCDKYHLKNNQITF